MRYLVYGNVQSIDMRWAGGFLGLFRYQQTYLKLSTGHEIIIDPNVVLEDEIDVGQFRFINCKGSDRELIYKASRDCDSSAEVKLLSRNLERAAKKAVDSTLKLNAAERAIVFRAAGIAISGTISASSLLAAAGMAVDGIAGTTFEPTALLGSLTLGAASGAYAWLQYEQLREDLKPHCKKLQEYKRAQKLYSSLMSKYIPLGAAGYTPLNPEVSSLMSTLRRVFDMEDLSNFWHNRMSVSSSLIPVNA